MEIQNEFKELLELFNKHKVEYILVGGYALAFHGAPRYTGDIDLLIYSSQENGLKILSALDEFGFGSLNLKAENFSKEGNVIQLGVPPVRIDIINSITGVTWEEASSGKVKGSYGEVDVNYIGKSEFIKNKKATGRAKDIADIESLGADGSSD